jgi:hypothetical protein
MKDAAQRRARDIAIREVFVDPESRHHEAVAEAELDIDYADSPIVMGDRGVALWPGQRLPDWIGVGSAAGDGLLHGHANRRGHTAFLIGGASATPQHLAQALGEIAPLSDGTIIEAAVIVGSGLPAPGIDCHVAPPMAERLGVGELTLLVVRADGHIGLRAERNHAEALSAYVSLLRGDQGGCHS